MGRSGDERDEREGHVMAGIDGPDRIVLRGIRGIGHHGVFAHERRDGQEFVVDVVVETDTRAAAVTDDLAQTVDYGTLAGQVHDLITGAPVDLLETLAARIADVVLGHERVEAVEVTVHKPAAPIAVPFGDVEVSIRRVR